MKWTLVSLDAQPTQSWRNGGGVTRELLAWPDATDWSVRLSVADVRISGPFSRFDGLERWFAIVEGDGVVLRSDFAAYHLTCESDPLRFDGGLPMDCTLSHGATRDFNLMALPGRSRMQRIRGAAEQRARTSGLLALYTHGREARLECEEQRVELPPYHLAWALATMDAAVRISGDAALWMEALT